MERGEMTLSAVEIPARACWGSCGRAREAGSSSVSRSAADRREGVCEDPLVVIVGKLESATVLNE